MDSILLGYIHYHFKLAYPFVCGSEAFFALAFVGFIIKSTNGFYLNHSQMKSDLYRAVVDSYVWTLMKHNCVMEVFLDEHRSRTGKINQPNEILFD
jgi:glycerol-3-phosphate O-acyltransferase